jgi:hypothetical protein
MCCLRYLCGRLMNSKDVRHNRIQKGKTTSNGYFFIFYSINVFWTHNAHKKIVHSYERAKFLHVGAVSYINL